MVSRIILLVLTTFILAQSGAAFPIMPGMGPVTAKYWIEYLSIFSRSNENGRKVFINVKQDLATMDGKSDILQKLGNETDKIINELKDLKTIDDNSLRKFPAEGRVFRNIMQLSLNYLVHDEAALVLFRNGLDVLLESFKLDCDAFVSNFTSGLQNYIDGLTDWQRRKESDLIDWFNNYKQISDLKQRREKFDDFVTKFSYV